MIKDITINWHLIEKCNFTCDYCFAKYSLLDLSEVEQSKEQIDIVLEKLYFYFRKEYRNIRLNLAGGEPTLSHNINYIIKKAYEFGFEVSSIYLNSCTKQQYYRSYFHYLTKN
jgi:radical S-adenosyl methionine domain-containing protein 2